MLFFLSSPLSIINHPLGRPPYIYIYIYINPYIIWRNARTNTRFSIGGSRLIDIFFHPPRKIYTKIKARTKWEGERQPPSINGPLARSKMTVCRRVTQNIIRSRALNEPKLHAPRNMPRHERGESRPPCLRKYSLQLRPCKYPSLNICASILVFISPPPREKRRRFARRRGWILYAKPFRGKAATAAS